MFYLFYRISATLFAVHITFPEFALHSWPEDCVKGVSRILALIFVVMRGKYSFLARKMVCVFTLCCFLAKFVRYSLKLVGYIKEKVQDVEVEMCF